MNEATLQNMTDEEFMRHLYMENPSDPLLREILDRERAWVTKEEPAQERVDAMESEMEEMTSEMDELQADREALSEALDTAIDELSEWPESDSDILADLRETRRTNGA